jgi:hypothetical protein
VRRTCEGADGDAEVGLGVLAELAIPAVRLVARDYVVAYRQHAQQSQGQGALRQHARESRECTWLDRCHALADALDDACSLVAEDAREQT